ncbi:hypothetical protein D7B24_001480 [Verticillium nonalfalfae]|uniref:gamma-glutamylcyclotransferase n=1 Tax=Verticillium nonalfalfae TaxID=1051616 RepID=A0A3M9YIZ0_9PEZI|nr:uncharacterized protein D7B24_001480 [Verticillium nonalfalfae]RNJ59756.1 hypothetical protein D7B24_001480 [Verticillium nonalfalfae]
MASVQEPCKLLRKCRDVMARPQKTYPPISSIPRTPEARLHAPPSTATSVLYLAYGSNLCAETFLGVRGIRPISQINVSAPTLDLVFDLPGVPYLEPCFANSALRKVPKLPDPTNPPKVPPIHPPWFAAAEGSDQYEENGVAVGPSQDARWTKGIVGVVYEVTPEDYGTILATEGGGSSYADILIPCFALPPRISVPEKPPIDLPKPFFAHTLFAPSIPEEGDGSEGDSTAGDGPKKPDDPRKKWYWRFIRRPHRDDPAYSQASARYLKLITDGAREHELPDDYQRYLSNLQAYTITTWKQSVGRLILLFTMLPFFFIVMFGSRLLADKQGRVPLWLAGTMAVVQNMTWMFYDAVLKPIFGDGERTQDKEGHGSRGWWRRQGCETDEETARLLD